MLKRGDSLVFWAAWSPTMVGMNRIAPPAFLPMMVPRFAFRTILCAVFAVGLASGIVGCDAPKSKPVTAAESESADEPTSPTVLHPFGVQTTRLEIENSAGLPATIYRVEGNDLIEARKLDPKETHHSFVVPSGFYLVQADIAFAAPAISGILDSQAIKIKICAAPKSQPGWCWIPAGPTVVGDTLGVGAENERPARITNVDAFWLAEAEVTNAQYAQFLSAQPTVDEKWIDLESMKCRVQKSDEGKFSSDAPDLPVVMVSFYGAQAYCDWLTEETKQTHRLPFEVEWEKAARGPNSNIYAYGNIYQQSLANQESGKLKEVKSYQPNAYGLYDMTGNVFEWMADQIEPNGDALFDQSLRGGSFVLDGMYLRNSFRMRQHRSVMTDDIGFRVAKEPN